ncbi:MAG: CZB domain-containing protein [Cocleimonas sp.]|nr:CZB domain-containing protein [Cocleimonas sp.]
MNEKAFFLRRINDHTQYLNKVTDTLRGRSNFKGTYACGCKLGHWLCGDAEGDLLDYGDDTLDVFYELYKEHQKFHDVSNVALRSHEAGNSRQETLAFTQMHVLSAKLITLLLALDSITANTIIEQHTQAA